MPGAQPLSTRDAIARAGIGLALFLALFGLFATMHPVFGIRWFAVAMGLALVGAASPRYRVAAIILSGLCALMIWGSYQEALRDDSYRQHVEEGRRLYEELKQERSGREL